MRKHCDHSDGNRVFVEGDHEPDGTQWPRCMKCGHRCEYAGMKPRSTRSIMKRHPLYVFTELSARREAIRMGSKYYAQAGNR